MFVNSLSYRSSRLNPCENFFVILFKTWDLRHKRSNNAYEQLQIGRLTGVGFGGKVDDQPWDKVGEANPRGRVGTPEDIAGIAIFLASRASAFTVGETITCDGGSVAVS